MHLPHLFLFAGIFFLSALLSATIAGFLIPDKFRQRLAHLEANAQNPGNSTETKFWKDHALSISQSLAKLALPAEGWEKSPIRLRFINAGWRDSSAAYFFFGAKTLLASVLPLLVLLSINNDLLVRDGSLVLLMCSLAACLGYYLPNLFLNHVIEVRQREIFDCFPDALDLLIICVEAGLALDSAMKRVAEEIHIKSKVLGQELLLVTLELRAGIGKERALRHLAARTGVEDIDLLVAMLIQSDRFGTSMGDSLRIHSEGLRVKRQQRAEETAAKISLKLLFPLILLIFPTLMVVLVGPAALQIYRVLLPALAGQN